MITSLTIHNFLSHKHTELSFVNGVNVLVGLSDAGKSAVMNALRWVMRNEPAGDSFRSWWGGSTYVKIVIDNTWEITRLRNDTENGYILQNLKDETVKSHFNAIKNGVPEEIANILNIDDINIQTQLSTHFLLSNTPGEAAKHFNKVAKLDKIDLANSNINSWINTINQDIKYNETELQKSTDKLATFNYLEKLEAEVEVLENLQNTLLNQQNNAKKLEKLISKLENVEIEIAEQQKTIEIEPYVNELLGMYSKRKEQETQYIKLNKLIKSIENTQAEVEENEKLIPAGVLIDEILQLYFDRKQKQTEYNQLKRLIDNIEQTQKDLQNAEIIFSDLHDKFDTAMPNKCPLCGTNLIETKFNNK
jgi:exonuclease SbcC